MSDLEPKRKLEHDEKALESSRGRAFDTGTRNVESAQVKAAENANPDRHNGSAGGDQEHSLEIVGFGATVSRKTQLTEKDLPKVPTEQDEIFADMYAHSTGLTTNNPGSIKMKNAFPNCLRLMREEY